MTVTARLMVTREFANSFSLWQVCLPPPQVSGDNGYANTSRLGQYFGEIASKAINFLSILSTDTFVGFIYIYISHGLSVFINQLLQ